MPSQGKEAGSIPVPRSSDSEIVNLENKYFSPEKALEYAKMSWPQWPENKVSEPFYSSLAKEVSRLTTKIQSSNPLCLEFGFGAGRMIWEISRILPSATIIGVEMSPSMIAVANDLLKGIAVTLIKGNAEKSGIKNEASDLTISVNVLDRVRNTTKAVKELARVTKKDGFILIANAFDYELQFTPIEEHLTPKTTLDLLKKSGCEIVEDKNAELAKILPSGEVKKYDEHILILRKCRSQFSHQEKK